MDIVINEELKAYIDPLTPDEYTALERSILAEGCRDALVLWGDVLVDGHNRYGICQKHGLPFRTVQNTRFRSMEDVYLWMIDQHLGRRSVSDFQRGVLALRKREILQERRRQRLAHPAPAEGLDATAQGQGAQEGVEEGVEAMDAPEGAASVVPSGGEPLPWEGESTIPAAAPEAEAFNSREALARAARLSSGQVVMIEKIQKQAAPELVAALKAGDISLNVAAAVATLPAEEQAVAARAGKDELKQAAKRVRESRRKPRATEQEAADGARPADDSGLAALRKRVAELTEENEGLRQQVALLQAELAAS